MPVRSLVRLMGSNCYLIDCPHQLLSQASGCKGPPVAWLAGYGDFQRFCGTWLVGYELRARTGQNLLRGPRIVHSGTQSLKHLQVFAKISLTKVGF